MKTIFFALLFSMTIMMEACAHQGKQDTKATQETEAQTAASSKSTENTAKTDANGNEVVVTNDNFQQLLNGEKPLMVDFWATWCGPCRAVAPTIASLADEYKGKVVVAKCDVDQCPELASKYGISAIPTVMFFKNGKMVDRIIGAVEKDEYKAKIDAMLK